MQKLGTCEKSLSKGIGKIALRNQELGKVKAGFRFTSLTETGLACFVSRSLFNPLSWHQE